MATKTDYLELASLQKEIISREGNLLIEREIFELAGNLLTCDNRILVITGMRRKFYPVLRDMSLVDYKVRVLSTQDGTNSVIRVLIESSDGQKNWGTLGVSQNIMEASWQALVDSIDYKLLIEEEKEEKEG